MPVFTLFAALLIAAPVVKDKPKPAEATPTGEWVAEKLRYMDVDVGVEVLKNTGAITLDFQDGTVLVRLDRQELTFGVMFAPTAKVKEIDVTPAAPFDGRLAGIYKIEGDALTICLGDKVGGVRPKEFKAEGPGVWLIVLKRVKK
jgi:uncharacterized protein (TIGR03067 family)